MKKRIISIPTIIVIIGTIIFWLSENPSIYGRIGTISTSILLLTLDLIKWFNKKK